PRPNSSPPVGLWPDGHRAPAHGLRRIGGRTGLGSGASTGGTGRGSRGGRRGGRDDRTGNAATRLVTVRARRAGELDRGAGGGRRHGGDARGGGRGSGGRRARRGARSVRTGPDPGLPRAAGRGARLRRRPVTDPGRGTPRASATPPGQPHR